MGISVNSLGLADETLYVAILAMLVVLGGLRQSSMSSDASARSL